MLFFPVVRQKKPGDRCGAPQFANPRRMLFLNQRAGLFPHSVGDTLRVSASHQRTVTMMNALKNLPSSALSPHLSSGRRQQEIRRSGGAWTSARGSNACVQRPLLADAGPGAFVTTLMFPTGCLVFFHPLFCKLNKLVFGRSEKWLRNKRKVEQSWRTWPGRAAEPR